MKSDHFDKLAQNPETVNLLAKPTLALAKYLILISKSGHLSVINETPSKTHTRSPVQ